MKTLVLLHVFAITAWACPKPNDKLLSGEVKPSPLAVGDWMRILDYRYVRPQLLLQDYLFTTGTWQYWDMFAPNPAFMDWYGDAVITYKDGTQKVSSYPRMFLLPIHEKYVMERYRKFYERAHDDSQYPYVFPAFCYHQALLNYKDPKNPPVSVGLRRHWHIVADPGQPQEQGYHQYLFYEGVIDPKILNAMKDGPP